MSTQVFGCFADENVKTVLVTMGKHHVRRHPSWTNSTDTWSACYRSTMSCWRLDVEVVPRPTTSSERVHADCDASISCVVDFAVVCRDLRISRRPSRETPESVESAWCRRESGEDPASHTRLIWHPACPWVPHDITAD